MQFNSPNLKLKRKHRLNSLFFKLLSTFLLCFILPVCVTCFAFYSVSVNAIQQEAEKYNRSQLAYISDKLDSTFSKAKDILCEYSTKDYVNNLNKSNKDIQDCMDSFKDTMIVNSFIDSIFIYDDAHQSVIANDGSFPIETYFTRQYDFYDLSPDKLQALFSTSRGFSIAGSAHYTRYVTPLQSRESDSILLLFTYTSRSRKITIGILMNPSAVDDIITDNSDSHDDEIYILDSDWEPILSFDQEIDFDSLLGEYSAGLNSRIWHNEAGEKILVNYTTSRYGLVLINAIPWTTIAESSRSITYFSFGLAACLILVSILLSLSLSNQIAQPIEAVSAHLALNTKFPLKVSGMIGRSAEYMDIYSGINQLQSKNRHLQSVLDDNRDSLRSSLLQSILTSGYHDIDFLLFRLSELDVKFSHPYFSVVLLKIDLYKNAYRIYSADELKNIRTGVCNLVLSWEYSCDCTLQTIKLSEDEFALIVNSADNDMELFSKEFNAISRLIDMENDQARLSFAITRFTDSITEIPDLFSSVQTAMNYRLINRQSQVINSEQLPQVENQFQLAIPTNVETSVANYIFVGDHASATQLISAQIDYIMEKALPYEYIKHLLSPFINVLLLALSSRNIPIADVFDSDPYLELHSLTNIDEIRDFFRYAYEKAGSYIISSRKSSSSSLQKILKYIQENFQRDLSLEEVSEYSNLSPQYFSRYFKEQMGVTFTDYVNQLRIQKAKVLLAEPDSLVNSVASAVGFENVNSFIRMFKRYEGISPGKYKSRSSQDDASED